MGGPHNQRGPPTPLTGNPPASKGKTDADHQHPPLTRPRSQNAETMGATHKHPLPRRAPPRRHTPPPQQQQHNPHPPPQPSHQRQTPRAGRRSPPKRRREGPRPQSLLLPRERQTRTQAPRRATREPRRRRHRTHKPSNPRPQRDARHDRPREPLRRRQPNTSTQLEEHPARHRRTRDLHHQHHTRQQQTLLRLGDHRHQPPPPRHPSRPNTTPNNHRPQQLRKHQLLHLPPTRQKRNLPHRTLRTTPQTQHNPWLRTKPTPQTNTTHSPPLRAAGRLLPAHIKHTHQETPHKEPPNTCKGKFHQPYAQSVEDATSEPGDVRCGIPPSFSSSRCSR